MAVAYRSTLVADYGRHSRDYHIALEGFDFASIYHSTV
jgi:hypothetical protein